MATTAPAPEAGKRRSSARRAPKSTPAVAKGSRKPLRPPTKRAPPSAPPADAAPATPRSQKLQKVLAQSGLGSRRAMEEMIKQNRSYTIDDFEISDNIEVRMLNEDVAILAYMVHEELTVDGKPVEFDATEASTWVRRNDRWLCALHTESIAGDAFGRDRKRATS